jgi:hypothetical protein
MLFAMLNNYQIRASVLELLCISPRLSEHPTELELRLIRHFIIVGKALRFPSCTSWKLTHSGMKSATSGFRYRCVAALRKFLLRLKDGGKKLIASLRNPEEKQAFSFCTLKDGNGKLVSAADRLRSIASVTMSALWQTLSSLNCTLAA